MKSAFLAGPGFGQRLATSPARGEISMLRVCASVVVIVMLTSAYVASPLAGWVTLAATSVFLVGWRWKKNASNSTEAHPTSAEAHQT
jgi:hypothetical protein